MADPSEISEENVNHHLSMLTSIQPTTKLGGRGTPRRKIRRSSNPNSTLSTAARVWENKLKPFRTQFQLQDHQDLCDVTLLYEDGRIEMQNQVHVHSTWPMTMHEIDASEMGTQTSHINELDLTSKEYLCGNGFPQEHHSNDKSVISTGNSSNYHQNLQQRQSYAPPSLYHMNYIAYQQNPYVMNSFEHYSNNIQQIYGNINTQSSETIRKCSKKRRRRRKHRTTNPSEQSTSISQADNAEISLEKSSLVTPENESIVQTKGKRKRQRVRKSKKSPPSSSSINTVEHKQSDIVLDQTSNHTVLSSSIDQNQYDDMLLPLSTPSQHVQPSDIDEEEQLIGESKQHVFENGGCTKIPVTSIPTVVVIDSDQTEDRNDQITRSSTPEIILQETVNEEILLEQWPSSSDRIQKASDSRASDSLKMSDDPVRKDSNSIVNERSPTSIKSAEVSVGEMSDQTLNIASNGTIDQDKTKKYLNPDAPDFKPIELAASHPSQRRATHTELDDQRNARIRFYSETNPHADSSTSIIRPLLSIVPQYIPHHRKSWASTTPLSTSSSSSWWPQEYSNPSSVASSYQTKAAYQIYTPLMEQPSLMDENGYSYNQQQKYPPKRPRANTGRPFIHPNKSDKLRTRSHSGPEPPSSPLSTHLTGIHSLARIMVDVLRLIKPNAEETKTSEDKIVSNNLSETSSIQNQYSSDTSDENPMNEEFSENNKVNATMEESVHEIDNEERAQQQSSTSVPEPSIEDDAEEKSGNQSRHMVKNTDDEERQQKQKHRQTNSTISSLDASKYFQSASAEKILSTEMVGEKQMHSASSSFTTSVVSNEEKASNMNILARHRDNGLVRENKTEKGNLPIEQDNWACEKKQMCTRTKEDKEIKLLHLKSLTIDDGEKRTNANEQKNTDTNHYCSQLPINTTNSPTPIHCDIEDIRQERMPHWTREKNTSTALLTHDSRETPLPVSIIDPTNTSLKASNITATPTINNNNDNKQDEQYVEATLSGDERAAMKAANVDDREENKRNREKGEKEKSIDNVERTPTSTETTTTLSTTREREKTEERERAKQANKNTDSVTSFTSEQHSCPSVVRFTVDDSMANRVSSSSYNRTTNNNYPNTSSSTNRSSRSTFTTHTYASTNTFNTEPVYTSTPLTGDPRTLHSYYLTSSNYHAPRPSPATSITRHYREYEPSYPSITRYRTPSSSSPFRKTHYLDDSDEEIINEEILEITDLNHYPTLIERWGDDTKTIVRQEGELKIEDFVEFEETEPTIIEEILYELVYSGDKLKTCRQIDRSRSESRNFRKIKKRRTKRKRQQYDGSPYLSSQETSRENSGTRSPYYHEQYQSSNRSTTPTQSMLSTSQQSTGFFFPSDRSSIDIPVRNRIDDRNYVNYVRVNESDPIHTHTQVQQYPSTRLTTDIQYRTIPNDTIERRATDLLDEMRHLSNRIDTLISTDNEADKYTSVIRDEGGITKIQLKSSDDDHKLQNLLSKENLAAIKQTDEMISSDRNTRLLTTDRRTDENEQSRPSIIDQTSVQKEISREDEQINRSLQGKSEQWEREDEDQSSTTEPTVREYQTYEQSTGRDTDEDASFSENEQILSKSFTSDEQQALREDAHPSNPSQYQHEIIDESSSRDQSELSKSSTETESKIPATMEEENALTSETNADLRSFLNTLTTHLLPDLSTSFDEETEEERSFEEPKSREDPTIDSEVQQSFDQSTTTIDDREKNNEEKSSSILESLTNAMTKVQETIIGKQEETSPSTDSLVNIVEEMKTIERQRSSSDEMSSKNLQSQDTNDRQEQPIPDTEESSQMIKQQDNLSSFTSADENLPSVNTSEEQQQQQIESRFTTTESTETIQSNVPQLSTELQSTQDLDSLATIVRQIGAYSQITRLPSTDIETETSQNVEHVFEQPSTEIIPSQLIKKEDVSEQKSRKEEEEAERLSTEALTETVQQILASTSILQPRSDLTTEEISKQPSVIDADNSITREVQPTDESVTVLTSTEKQTEEQPSIENLVTIVHEIPTSLSTPSQHREEVIDIQLTSTEKHQADESQLRQVPEIVETITTTTTEETEEERHGAPSESIATTVPDIEESSVQSITKDAPTPSITAGKQEDIDQIASTKTTEITSITEAGGETIPDETSKQIEAERLTSDAAPLQSVHAIANEATARTEHFIEEHTTESSIPNLQSVTSTDVEVQERSADVKADETPESTKTISVTETVEETPKQVVLEDLTWEALTGAVPYPPTTQTEEQVEKTTTDSSIPDVQQVTSTEAELQEQPVTKEEESPESTKTTSIIETVEETPKQVVLEDLTWEALTGAVPYPPTTQTEAQVEQITTDSSIPDVQQVTSTEAELQEQPITKEEEFPESTKTTSIIETVEETPRQVVLEDLTWEALAGAVPYPPTTQTEEQVEKTATDASIPDVQQVTSVPVESAEKPSTIKEDETLESTNTTFITETMEAEELSSEALAGIVHEILAMPRTVHLPSAEYTAEMTANIPTQEDKLTIISPVATTETSEILASSLLPTTDVEEGVKSEPTASPSTNEIAPESILEEIEAERLSKEALTEAIHEISQTTTTTDQSSERKGSIHTEEQMEQPPSEIPTSQIVETVTMEKIDEKPFDTKDQEVPVLSEASPIIETVEDTTNEVESERPSSIPSTEVVSEILATPFADRSASLEAKSESTLSTTSSEAEEKVALKSDQPSTNVEQTDEEETSTTAPSETTTAHDTSVEDQEFFDAVEGKKEESEPLPIESLTKVASEILAGAFSYRRPSTEHIEESTKLVEQEQEKPSSSIFGSIVQQIKDVYHDLTGTSEEPSSEKTTTEEKLHTELTTSEKPLSASLDDQFTDDHPVADVSPKEQKFDLEDTSSIATTEEHVQRSAREQTPEDVAERISADAIIDAVHEILNKSSDDLPSSPEVITDESIAHTEDESEQSTTDSSFPNYQQVTSTESKTQDSKKDETLQSIQTTSITEIVEEKSKEAEPEEFSSEALSGIVRDILATPVTVHLPSIETTTEEDKPVTSTLITTTTEVEEDVQPESLKSSLDIETEQKPDTGSLSTQALTEAVRDILATPVTVHLPSVTTTEESTHEPSVDSTIPVSEETTTVKKDIEVLQSVQTPSVAETVQEPAQEKAEDKPSTRVEEIPLEKTTTVTTVVEQTSQPEQLPDDVKETSEEQILSTDSLAQTVRDILATPVFVHLPSVEHPTESTNSTEENSEDLSEQPDKTDEIRLASNIAETKSESIDVSSKQIDEETNRTMSETPSMADLSSVTNTSETILEDTPLSKTPFVPTDEDWEIVELPADSTSTVETVQEVDSKDQSISVQDTDKEAEANRLALETSTNTVPLPSVDSPRDTTTFLVEQPITQTFPSSDEEATAEETTSEDATKLAAERITSETITQAVEDILAAPASDYSPFVDSNTFARTSFVDQEIEKPTTDISFSSDDETATKSEVLKSIDISSATETAEDTTSEEQETPSEEARKLAAERITSEVLAQAVEEISAVPPSDRVAAVDTTTTDTSFLSDEARKTVAERITSETLTKAVEEAATERQDTLAEDARRLAAERITSDAVTKAMEEISTTPVIDTTTILEKQQIEKSSTDLPSSAEEEARQVAAERITSDVLTKAVEEIIATAAEETASEEARKFAAERITSDVLTKAVDEITATAAEETASEEARKFAAERITSEALAQAVEAISAAPTIDHFTSSSNKLQSAEVDFEDQLSFVPSIEKEVKDDHLSSEVPTETFSLQSIGSSADRTTSDTDQETTTVISEGFPSLDETKDETSGYKTDDDSEISKISSFVPAIGEKTSDDVRKAIADQLSSEALVKAVEEITTTQKYQKSAEENLETAKSKPAHIVARSEDKTIDEPTDADSTQTIPEVTVKATTYIQELSPRTSDEQSPSSTSKISSISLAHDHTDPTSQAAAAKTSSDYLMETNDQSSAKFVSSVSYEEVTNEPTTSVRTHFIESSEEKPEFNEVIPSEDDQTTFQSPAADTHEVAVKSEPEDEPNSLLLYTTANDFVTDTIAQAHRSLQESDSVQNNEQPLSTDHAPQTDDLANIVETMLSLSQKSTVDASIPDEDKQSLVTSNFVDQVTTSQPTPSIETTIKLPILQIQVPDETDTTEESSPKRASAVIPSLTPDDSSNDTSLHSAPIFFVPGTPTPMETDFREIYDHRHFVLAPTQEPEFEFSAVNDEEIVSSAPQVEEKKAPIDLPLAYFELQEQRHTLLSPQQSTENEKTETKESSLTAWTTTHPLIDYENIEEKKEISDVNLDDNAYEYARRFDLESPSVISNLPTTEYHQVFGVSDDVINTMDDMTQKVADTLSQDSDISEQSVVSDRTDEIAQSQVELSSSAVTEKEIIPDNVQRINEALDALESDLHDQSRSIKTDAPEYNTLSTTLESDIRQTPKDRSEIVLTQDEQATSENKSEDDLTSNAELDGRYSVLLNRIDSLEKPLLDLQSSAPSSSETQTVVTETDDSRPLHERYDVLLDHVHRLTEATNENLASESNEASIIPHVDEQSIERQGSIDGLAQTMEEILAKPVRTIIHPYEKFAHQEQAEMSSLESALEQIIARTQFQTNNIILPAPVDTIRSSIVASSQKKEISETEASGQTSTSAVLKEPVTPIQEEEEIIEEKPQPTRSIATIDVIPVITVTRALSDPADSIEFPDEESPLSSSNVIEEEDEEPLSTDNLVDVLKSISPSALRTTELPETSSEDIVSSTQNEQEQVQEISSPVAGYFTSSDVYHAYKQPIEPVIKVEEDADQTAKSSGSGLMETIQSLLPSALRSSETDVITSEEDLSQDIQPTVEKKEQESVAIPSPNDFSSSDVDHADKQSVIPIIAEEKTADTDDQVATDVTDIPSSGISALPTLRPSEDRISLSDRSSYSEEDASSQDTAIFVGTRSTPELNAFDEEIVQTKEYQRHLSKSLQSVEKIEEFDEQEPRLSSSGGLLEIMKSFTPSTLRSTKQEQEVSQTTESTVETDQQQLLSSSTFDDSSSANVDQLQEQPLEASSDEKESTGILDRAKSLVSNIISSATSVLPTSTASEEPVTISDTESSNEQEIALEKTVESTVTESIEQPSSTGLLEIMKSFVPSSIRSKTSSITESEEPLSTATEEKAASVSSTLEPAEKSAVFEEHPIDNIQSQDNVDTSAETISHEKESTGLLSRLTTAVSDVISAVQHALPTSASSRADAQEQESVLQTSLVEEEQRDHLSQSEPTVTETPVKAERPTSLLKESVEDQAEVSNIDEEKDVLIETSKEILAAPLQSAVDKYEEIVSTQQEPSSSKVTTSDHSPSETTDSKVELLSAAQPTVTDGSEQQETITTSSTSIAEEKPSQPLQVVNDDYAWYSSHYTIADADAKVAALYQKLSDTIKQLDQRPTATTLEFQPEPLEKVSSSDYDRQALADTKDTREKVHELAQLSTKITGISSTTTTTTSSPEEPENDDSGFQVVQRRKRIPSSTAHEKTSSITTPQSPMSPDIDLKPLVLQGKSSVPSTVSSAVSQTTTTTTITSTGGKKKKDKKKNKKEMMLYDASIPTGFVTDEPKAETAESPDVEEHSESSASITDELKAATVESPVVEDRLEATSSLIDEPKAEIVESSVVEERLEATSLPTEEPKAAIIESIGVEERPEVTTSVTDERKAEIVESPVVEECRETIAYVADEPKAVTIELPVVEERFVATSPVTDEPKVVSVESPVVEERLEATSPVTDEPKVVSVESPVVEECRETIAYVTEETKAQAIAPINIEERAETTASDLPLVTGTDVLLSVDQKPEDVKEESKQKLVETFSETQFAEPLSTSNISDVEEIKDVDDEKNDSTSSDASQWLSSSFVTIPEDAKTDVPVTEESAIADTAAVTSSSVQETAQVETKPVSTPTKKKKKKSKPVKQELKQQSERPPSPPEEEEEEEESEIQPIPTPVAVTKTTAIRSIVVTSPEEPDEEDNEGFQVVSYRKHPPSGSGSEKTSPPSSTSTPAQKIRPNTERQAAVTQQRQDTAKPASAPGTKTKKKSKKDETDPAAALSSTSTDTDFVSSSSIDSSQAKLNKAQAASQDKKRTEVKQSKSLQSSSETFSTEPSQTSEEKAKQQQQTTLQSQLAASSLPSLPTVTESDMQSLSSLPPLPPTKTVSATTLRVKAFTSPEEEEEEDDNEGFQVVHHRKRISSAPRSDKSLPPIPPRSPYKQNYGRDNNRRPLVVHGRHGSETRSMPRTTTGGQTAQQRQQNRPNQNVRQAASLNTVQPSTPPKTRISSLSDVESRRPEQNQAPFSDQRPRISSDIMLQTISTEPKSQSAEQQFVPPVAQPVPANQIEQPSFSMSIPVAKPTESVVQEYRSTAVEDRTPARTRPSPTITVIGTPATKKTKLADEEDDDGFRVVRYRRHTPSSPTTTTVSKQQPSSGSDSDRRRANIPRKQSSSPSVNLSSATASAQTMPKKKPAKPKKSRDETTGSHLSSSANTLSTSTDADFASSSMEEFKIESTSQYPRASSPILPSSSAKVVTKTTTTSQPAASAVQEPVQSSILPQTVQKPLDETKTDVQSTVPTTSSPVPSADTNEESGKKPKKKHKRLRRDPVGSEVSTPSEDISSTSEPLFTTKPALATTQTETISTTEEVLSSPTVETSTTIEDDQDAPPPGKKPAKRRRKKAQTTDEESDITSSTTSTTDKDSSSAAVSASAKQVSLESSSASHLVSDADKHESEWITPHIKTTESTVIESTVISPANEQTPISFQSPAPKIIPGNVTDVQFKFQKSGELTVTSQTSLERSPTQWGTVKFPSEEQDLPETSITEQESTPQSATADVPVAVDSPIKPETPTKSNESSEAAGENDLEAYRDSTGRLRRKKPRKSTSGTGKSDEISTPVEQQQPPSEEEKIDQTSISEPHVDVLTSPLPKSDEPTVSSGFYQSKRSFEYENTSDTSSKLDSFLPDYIREQIKATSIQRASSTEPSTPVSQVRSIQALPPSPSNRSTSTDTSENESRKPTSEFIDEEFYVADSSSLPSTTDQTEGDTLQASSSSLSTSSLRKKKQRPKMLKKDLEAKTLLTHEFDEAPSTTAETQPTTEEENKDDGSFLSSIRHQLSSAISNLSESFTSAISSKSTTHEPTTVLRSDEPVPSMEESPTPSPIASSEVITTTNTSMRKSSTRAVRKRSKRDSGPDYETIVFQSTGDNEQSLADRKLISTLGTSSDDNQSDQPRNETYKPQSRQRTTSGRLISNTEEENEQQAILADDEEDEDVIPKPTSFQSIGRSSRDSSLERQDIPSSDIPQQKQETSTTEVTDESQLDNEATSNEQLRPVQGFHSFTPNKYQYNQYEEASTTSTESAKPVSIESESGDAVLARGLTLWLQQEKGTESDSSMKKKEKSTGESGLTRAMQSLIIQPVESEDDAEEEEDSWNGPRAKKPTYTTGIPIVKRIHSTSAYNINHPRTTTTKPSWLISPSIDKPSPDNSSKYEDEEENSLDDASDKQPAPSSTLNSQFSTKEERQTHLTNLADLTFQPTTSILSSSSSSLSSTAKWNDTSVRSDDNQQQQTSFTEDDVQRCLGENFYRESLAVDTLPTEQRTITSLSELVLKPSQSLDDADDDDLDTDQTNRNKNNNNNNQRPINFDEWAHFLQQNYNQEITDKTSSPIEQTLSTSPACSYARVIDDDTLISDPNRSKIIEIPSQSHDNDKTRYGDFSSLNDDTDDDNDESSPMPQSTSQVPQYRPSETFQRWRQQSTRASTEHSLSNQNSLENQNDDEILISHTDGGLSRRVRPSS